LGEKKRGYLPPSGKILKEGLKTKTKTPKGSGIAPKRGGKPKQSAPKFPKPLAPLLGESLVRKHPGVGTPN